MIAVTMARPGSTLPRFNLDSHLEPARSPQTSPGPAGHMLTLLRI